MKKTKDNNNNKFFEKIPKNIMSNRDRIIKNTTKITELRNNRFDYIIFKRKYHKLIYDSSIEIEELQKRNDKLILNLEAEK